MQKNLFEPDHILYVPEQTYGLMDKLEQSREIMQKAIADTTPYAVGIMVSGGDDSVTMLQVAIMLGVRIDFIMHGVTGTGLPAVRKYVNRLAASKGIRIIEADAGTTWLDTVLRKGFLGMGKAAHSIAYHLLKQGPFEAALSKYIRKGIPGRRIILLNGVRIEESDNRLDNFGDNPYRRRKNNFWVNGCHYWLKTECLEVLDGEGVERSPVAIATGRSSECNCGPATNEADRLACREVDRDWGDWMWGVRKEVIKKFGWDIGQTPSKERLAEIKAEAALLSDDMPMCVGCKARTRGLFDDIEL